MEDRYFELYEEIRKEAIKILPYYTIDKTKPYGVYIWSRNKDEDMEENVFDIYENELTFYVDNHEVIEEAKPIIENIQKAIKNLREYNESCK